VSKHTAGAWKAYGLDPRQPITVRSGKIEIATLKGSAASFSAMEPERTSNAFLIIAAPKMLAMLKRLATISTMDSAWDDELQDLIAEVEGR